MTGAVVSVTLLILLAAVHLYWAGGGRAGKAAAIPERNGRPVLKPGSFATMAVALALLVAAAIIATQAGFIFPGRFQAYSRICCGVLALIFLGRAVGDFRYVGFFKTVVGTRFARLDSTIFSPMSLVLAVSIADATLGSGRHA